MTEKVSKISETTWIALYGAVVGTASLLWNIYRHLTDKGRLKVYCYLGKIVSERGPKDENDYLVYNVTNVGRKPIFVDKVGGTTKVDKFILPPRKLPKRLDPGETLLEYISDLSVLNDNLTSLWALDSLGKYHKVKKSVVKSLIEKAKKKRNTSKPGIGR
jgi:hypothetical protein